MRVKAAVVRSLGRVGIEDLDLTEPLADQILVRLVASGVAHVDLDAIEGRLAMPLPFVPGAEGAGIVERVGDAVVDLATGDAVLVVPSRPSAGSSDGPTPFKAKIGTINGFFCGQSSFATHLLCNAAQAIKLPIGAPVEILAGFAGEGLLGALAVSHIEPDDTIVVTGANATGLAAIMVAKALGARMIILADPDEERRNLATAVGATVAVHTDADLSAVVKSMAADGARLAIDTTGHSGAIQACRDSMAPNGVFMSASPAVFDDDVPSPETRALVDKLAALHAAGDLPIERLVTFFPFELVTDALEALAKGRVVKPVIRFSLGSFGDLDRAEIAGAAADASGNEGANDTPEPIDEPVGGAQLDRQRETPEPV